MDEIMFIILVAGRFCHNVKNNKDNHAKNT